jgi:hypothetical protein
MDARALRLDPLRALGLYYVATGAWALVDLRSFMFAGSGRSTSPTQLSRWRWPWR